MLVVVMPAVAEARPRTVELSVEGVRERCLQVDGVPDARTSRRLARSCGARP